MNQTNASRFGKILLEPGAGAEAGGLAAAPFKLKKILVPVDFSACSRKALKYALTFAEVFRAELVLVHVVQEHYFPGAEFGAMDFPILLSQLKESAGRELQALVQQEIADRLPVLTVIRTGQPANEIVEAARKAQADLIVIATHGHTGLKHVFLGSTAESVVRHAPCPVLTVREGEREFIS
ncbi:MAG: universal stress protein [Verrucomicrobia bacterium]|nr:universal stress protein [Verrucomicrobiota bacterium]